MLSIRAQNLAGAEHSAGVESAHCESYLTSLESTHSARSENSASDGKLRPTSQTEIISQIRQLSCLLLHSKIYILSKFKFLLYR